MVRLNKFKVYILMMVLSITLPSYAGINCSGYDEWKSGSQTAGRKTYLGKVYETTASNGWDCGGCNPLVNTSEWTYVDDCSDAPEVTTTDPPSSVTSSSMTLRGTIGDEGASSVTERGFIYGTDYNDVDNSTSTSLQGSSIAVTQTGTTGAYTKGISSLCPGATYYYKAYAKNSHEEGYGTVENETTSTPGTYTTTQAGAFTSAATWGGCSAPDLDAGHTINIGHAVTSGSITLSEGTDIIVTSGGTLTTTGTITFGGTGTVTSLTINSGGTVSVTNIGFTNASSVTNNGTLTVTNELDISSVATVNSSGTTTIATLDNNNGDFNQTAGTVNVTGNYDCANDCDFDQSGGDMTVGGNFKVWGSGESHMDGTLDVSGTIIMDNNGYMDGYGVLTYNTSNVNPNNSGAYIGCAGGTKYDDNALTGWDDLIASPWDLTACVILPVELIEFYLSDEDEATTLYWTTGSEINNDFFEIQTSSDGVNWVSIGRVMGIGNTTEVNHYTYQLKGSYKYFRLKQVDLDGQFAYSKIIMSSNYKDNSVINSSRYFIMVRQEERYIVSIYQIDGALVYEEEHEGTVFISKGKFRAGIYVVKVGEKNIKMYVHGG